ncbi:hypothetical protein C0993_008175, partial [Termitomyces sp. T159_Od127]
AEALSGRLGQAVGVPFSQSGPKQEALGRRVVDGSAGAPHLFANLGAPPAPSSRNLGAEPAGVDHGVALAPAGGIRAVRAATEAWQDRDVALAVVREQEAELIALKAQVAELESRVVREVPREEQAVEVAQAAEWKSVWQQDWALLEVALSQEGALQEM